MPKHQHVRKLRAPPQRRSTASHKKAHKPPKTLLFNPLPTLLDTTFGAPTYEESMIGRIMSNGSAQGRMRYEAFLLGSVISNTSKSMDDIRYRFGVYLGRTLFRHYRSRKQYALSNEPIMDLVSFFESVGYRSITYSAFSDKPEFKFHKMAQVWLGAKTHSFEAGIMSGFMSASTGRLAPISELECLNNGGDCCRFAYDSGQTHNKSHAGIGIMDRFSDSLVAARRQNTKPGKINGDISGDYVALSWAMLLDGSYNDEIRTIARYIGASIGAKLFKTPTRKGNPVSAYKKAVGFGQMLGFGIPYLVGTEPLHIRLSFSPHFSRAEFVAISVSFYNGIFSAVGASGLSALRRNSRKGYTVDIRAAKSQIKQRAHK
jgi:predicted hydrocarbon binding protein